MYGSILPLMRMAGFGMRRHRRRVKHHGGRKMRMMIQGSGRRHHRRTGARRMRGRGFFDTLKNIGSKALGLVRSVPIISSGLKLAGQDKYSDMAKSIGLGRRRKRRTHYGGRMSVYGGRRRVHRRRVHRGGRRRATKRRFSVFGGRRKRHYRLRAPARKRGGHKMRGGFLGSLLSGLLGGRRHRKRTHRRRHRIGGRRRVHRRTYRIGLFSRRR